MAEITNTETLHAEINRLRVEVKFHELSMRKQLVDLKQSLKPASILSAGLRSMVSKPSGEQSNHFVRESVKTGILLLMGRFFLRPGEKSEQHVSSIVDNVFDKVKGFIEKRRNRKKENRFYKFNDEFDSESN